MLPAAVPVETFCEVSATGNRVNSSHTCKTLQRSTVNMFKQQREDVCFCTNLCANLVTNKHPEEVMLSKRLSPLLSDEVIRL